MGMKIEDISRKMNKRVDLTLEKVASLGISE